MRPQSRYRWTSSGAGLLLVLGALAGAAPGCHFMFGLDPADADRDDDASDADGAIEVDGDDVADDADIGDDVADDAYVGDDVADDADIGDDAPDVEAGACGNGMVDPDEECDDGNDSDTDACLSGCVSAWCGDGRVWAGVEACDDGNTANDDGCVGTCRNARCGDGFVRVDFEECDDGNTISEDACLNTCVDARCGDAVTWTGVEQCDDGNASNADACLNTCVAATCGDGIERTGVEECDDGNLSDTDGCVAGCLDARCGDGFVWSGVETCDDGNTLDGDSCPGICRSASCGNGFPDAGEDCDDGNSSNTDACLNDCSFARCGDSYVRAGVEECEGSATRPCVTGCTTSGTQACFSCAWSSTCTPPDEACNGTDDDCDTLCDDGFACCAGTSGSCTTSCLSTGTDVCNAGCGWGSCAVPSETCNGRDDDCDTVCDNGFACCVGQTGSCTTSCLSAGTRSCTGGCGWRTCTAPAETCNGADDDCDTVCDDGFACCAGQTNTCITSCLSTGARTCSASCAWGATCAPPPETCNGRDDDCDTSTDEGCSACAVCGGALAISPPGGRRLGTLTAGAGTTSGICGGAGAEAVFTFTTTATQDVFLTTHASAFDTVLYVRRCDCDGVEVGCNDDDPQTPGRTGSTLYLRDLPAGTYKVFVDAKAAAGAGAYQLDVYLTAPGVSGDRCGDPLHLTAAGETGRNSCSFSGDYVPSSHTECARVGAGGGEDVVYYFVLTATTVVRLRTCNSQAYCPGATCVDTAIYVRDICESGVAQRDCNDNRCGFRSGSYDIHSDTQDLSLPAGLYYLFVDGYQEPTGTWLHCGRYDLTVSGVP